ncbi:MAG: glycosyltransferase family 9 protein [Bacteroidota bacterium]
MKVLIIQQKMIGDVLATSILFEAIKSKYPDSELHYLINSNTFPVVENHPHIDVFQFYTPDMESSKLKLWRFAKSLRREHYDTVIDVYSKLSSNLITLLSGAKTKISVKKSYTSFLYHHTFKNKDKSHTNAGLALENRLQLLKPLSIDTAKTCKPKIYLKPEEIEKAKQVLDINGIHPNHPIFMIGVLGSDATKTYPLEYMAEVIDYIAANTPESQILFNYIPSQESEARSIFDLCKPETQSKIFINLYGKSLRDFLSLTSHCTALIGNEGGATNMAKALNIPTFTIFSPWIKREAWNMFEDGEKNVSVHLEDYSPEIYKNLKHPKTLKSQAEALYQSFQPELFEPKLNMFLSRINY